MDNVLVYWLTEYIKVFFAYSFVLFIWPLIVFRKYLSGKSVTFKFCFCSTAQIVIINTMVLMLGLVHLLNKWTMCIVFYGILLWSLRDKLALTEQRVKKIKYLVTGTMGWKHYFLHCRYAISKSVKENIKKFKKFYKKHAVEYTVLMVVLLYGMIYFSYGAFRDYSYGFGDMYVHHSWVYGLIQGKIFSAGVYPEGMHCVIYSLHALLGINVYSAMLFMAGIHIVVILLAAYCLLKEIFCWRFSSLFVLILFLTLDLVCINEVFSMSRLQWTLPQEYGFHTMYICLLYLIKYLKSYKTCEFRGVELKACWDENLLIFMTALAASIIIHFYVTIMAFFFCFSFAIFKLGAIFHKKHIVPLITAAFVALLIAAIPMGGALASGIPFQGSIGWALNVMNGTNDQSGSTQIITQQNNASTNTTVEDNISTSDSDGSDNLDAEIADIQELKTDQGINVVEPITPKESLGNKIKNKAKNLGDSIVAIFKSIYKHGYVTLYKPQRAKWIVGVTFFVFGIYFVYRIISIIYYRLIKGIKKTPNIFEWTLPIVLLSFVFMLLYGGHSIGLPALVAGARLCSTGQMAILMMMVIPIDMLFSVFKPYHRDDFLELCSTFVAIGLVVFIYMSGSYHGYLYYELTRYNSAVMVTNEIMDSLPDNTYTIISTTDEIYQVIQNGRHEELLTFIQNQSKDYYTIPTEYLFIYVEKKPIKYAHNHFFAGPKWLALERYHEIYKSNYSCCTDVLSAEISEQYADESLMYFNKPSKSYSNLESRTILESKMYRWCQQFNELYPNELKVYYEDDDFVCYYIQQNPQFLYNLVLE